MKVTINASYKIILAVFLLCITHIITLHAQQKEIRIGDTLPEAVLPEIIKYPTGSVNLSDFTDKAILIDFWFTNCTACIAKFPFLDSISKEFRDDLHILQVTRDSKEKVTDFFTRSDRWKHIDFPCVVNDTVMNQLFPHRGEPHYVWVGKDGIVKAITDGEEVKRENLFDLVNGRPLKAKLKDENRSTDQFWGLYPLMLDYPEIKDDLITYSFFAKSRGNGFRAAMSNVNPIYYTSEKYYRLRQMGTTFNMLYSVAYGLEGSRDYHPSRIIHEDPSKAKYLPSFNIENRQNIYDFDLIVRDTSTAKFFRYMQSDLDKYFDVKSSFVKREIDVLVLKEYDSSEKYKSADPQGFREQYADGDRYIVKNIPIDALLRMMNNDNPIFPYQVLNETGFNGQISFEVNIDISNMKNMRKSFHKYGLDLVLEKRLMDIVLIQ